MMKYDFQGDDGGEKKKTKHNGEKKKTKLLL